MPSDYYLNDFSTEELLEVVEKKDEWSETDYGWAKKILIQKKILTEEKLEALHQNRLFDLAKQKRVKTGWLVLLYVFGIFGWIAGIFTGAISAVSTWVIIAQSKTLPSGKQLFIYDKYSRNHAYVLLAINIIAIIIVFFIGPFNLFNAFF